MTPLKNLLVKRVCVFPPLGFTVESLVLEDESVNGVSSTRLSSRNCSPKFCPLDGFLSLNKCTSFLNAIDEGLLLLLPLPPLPPLLLSRRSGLSRFVEATVSRCMLECLTVVSTLFESCEP